jgi:KaiC/GvpD/RAD55 family RecA-like ATPase
MGEKMFVNLRDGLSSKPKLILTSEFNENLIKNPNKDWYVSLFQYNEEHRKILEEKGSLAGITNTITNRLYFDFDCKGNLDNARADALTAAHRLVEKGINENAINCYFTGGKGFSIEVETNNFISPAQFKNIVFNIAGDLATFDRVVNDPNRIVRIANTKHQSSGLYKIPLTPEELTDMTIADIKTKASSRRVIEIQPVATDIPVELLNIPVEKPVEKPIERIIQELTFDISSFDLKNRMKGFDESRWLIANGFFRSGERNSAMLCLAATCKNLHMGEKQTRGMLHSAADDQAARTGEERFPKSEIENIIKQVYGPHWKGGMFTTRDPNNWLSQYARRIGLKNVQEEESPKTIMGIVPGFVNYIKNIEKNTIKTGIPSLDHALPLTIGMGLAVVAAPGAGKTSFALETLEHNSILGIPTVFASLDMTRNRLFQKVVYKVTGMSKDDLYACFREGKYQDVIKQVQEKFGNVWFMDKSAASINDIKNFVKEVEAQNDIKIKMVMIDYFERVNTDVADDTAASKKVSNEIQDMIAELDVLCITLYQPAKHAYSGGPDAEIVSYAAIKGSSYIIQANRAIISLSRPFFTPKTKELDRFIVINILKNDLGELDHLELGWEGKRGRIFELEDSDRQELKELMKTKNGEKSEKGEGGWN